VRKDANVQPPFTAHVLLRSNTSGFDRLSGNPATLQRLQTEIAKHDPVAARGITF
jgi:hypothetical protein